MQKTNRVIMWAAISVGAVLALWGILVVVNKVSPEITEDVFPGSWYPFLFKIRVIGIGNVWYYSDGRVRMYERRMPRKDRPRVRGSGRYYLYGEAGSISPDGKERYTLQWPNATGRWVVWTAAGTKDEEVYYIDGEKDGTETTWYPDGQRLWEREYKNGKLDGRMIRWYENGQMSCEQYFREDRLIGGYRQWYENGTLAQAGSFNNNEKVGIWQSYSPDGGLASTLEFPNANGPWVEWYFYNGRRRRCEQTYVNGKLNGKQSIYEEPSGRLIEENWWNHGELLNQTPPGAAAPQEGATP